MNKYLYRLFHIRYVYIGMMFFLMAIVMMRIITITLEIIEN